jgi:outer membrane murein-binding lipoprotein Lpp
METAGIEVKRRGSRLSFRGDGKGYICLRSLKDDYTEGAIRERIAGRRAAPPKRKTIIPAQTQKINLLIDIQNSIKTQGSPGYERWAKIFNLKSAARTLIFLQENGLDDMDKLSATAQKAKDDFNSVNARIQAIDKRLAEITALQKHIGSYSKTRDIYTAYRKAGYSKKFYAEHRDDIELHKAAKKFFDSLGLEKLPTITTLKTEYAALSDEKKKLYAGYHQARSFMQDILSAKQNTEQLLSYREAAKEKETERI